MSVWKTQHNYLQEDRTLLQNERKTVWVVFFSALMMVVEIVFGFLTSSMALLADGWHMAAHTAALGITVITYRLARSPKMQERFTFGAGKFIPLGGYTSAIVLALIAILMGLESIHRFLAPQSIQFNEALTVAIIGLIVNAICAALFHSTPDRQPIDALGHLHPQPQETCAHRHDHNMQSAYVHILTDAFTSILAIVALLIGKIYGLVSLDALMGIVGSVLILKWSVTLCKETGFELLDGHAKAINQEKVKEAFENEQTHIACLHVWRVAPLAYACEMVIHTQKPQGIDYYKQILKERFHIQHVVIEENIL